MHLRHRFGTSLLLTCLIQTPLPAQSQRSPVQDLLAGARAALNDLRYADADSITQYVLSLDRLRRAERIQALQLSAASVYPEQTDAQHRDRATESMRQLIRIAPSATLPKEISWSGLDDLYQEVRRATFGASASVPQQVILTGPDELAEIEVVTSRTAAVSAWLAPASGGRAVRLDSTEVSNRGTLRFKVLQNGQPWIPNGDYRLVVSAIDALAADTIRLSYNVVVTAPPISYVEVPRYLDSARLLPERTKPRRVGGIVAGAVVMAATVAGSRLLRDDELKVARPDRRAVTLGIALGLGTAGGVWLFDRGSPIPANQEANRQLAAEFSRAAADAAARNAELLRTYRADISITPEVP